MSLVMIPPAVSPGIAQQVDDRLADLRRAARPAAPSARSGPSLSSRSAVLSGAMSCSRRSCWSSSSSSKTCTWRSGCITSSVSAASGSGIERQQLRRVQVGHRIEQVGDLRRLQRRHPAVVVAALARRPRIAAQELDVAPVEQAPVADAVPEHAAAEPPQHRPGPDVGRAQPQACPRSPRATGRWRASTGAWAGRGSARPSRRGRAAPPFAARSAPLRARPPGP